MILDLVRHADTGRRGYFDGRCDSPLLPGSAHPVRDAHAAIAWSRVIASPLQRAHDTARAMAAPQALDVEVSEDWAEWHFGDWDGLHRDDIDAQADGRRALEAFYRDPFNALPPNAESGAEFSQRIRRGLDAAVAGHDDTRPALVVTHAGALRMAVSLACAIPLSALWSVRIGYGTRVRLHVEPGEAGVLWGELIEVRQVCDG